MRYRAKVKFKRGGCFYSESGLDMHGLYWHFTTPLFTWDLGVEWRPYTAPDGTKLWSYGENA